MVELILGGARSGKSALAEQRAAATGMPVTYIATAQALDAEMTSRIEHHRGRRPAAWKLVEEPLQLAKVLKRIAMPDHCVLVDCLTIWLSNIMCSIPSQNGQAGDEDERIALARNELAAMLPALPGHLILVSNEVGMGIVPAASLGRVFRDEQGRLNQAVAAVSDHVTLVVAGLPLVVK